MRIRSDVVQKAFGISTATFCLWTTPKGKKTVLPILGKVRGQFSFLSFEDCMKIRIGQELKDHKIQGPEFIRNTVNQYKNTLKEIVINKKHSSLVIDLVSMRKEVRLLLKNDTND